MLLGQNASGLDSGSNKDVVITEFLVSNENLEQLATK